MRQSVEYGKYKIGEWNTNGFNSLSNPYNTIFKKTVISILNLDILILVETHCLQNDIIEVEDYKVIQYNRQNVSRNAIRGSGGVAILISNNILGS